MSQVKLTPKQEKFCQCIVSGMSGKDSYLTAYDCQSDNAAMVESTKLLARNDINERLKELRKPIENLCQTQAITEREKKRSWLWNVINDINTSQSDKLRAMDILNKMDAEYININRNIEDKAGDIKGLDTTTLERLASTL